MPASSMATMLFGIFASGCSNIMNEGKKATGGIFSYLPLRFRSVPVLGAMIVGFLTIFAVMLVAYEGPGREGSGVVLFLLLIPFMFLGFEALDLIYRLFGLSAPPQPPDTPPLGRWISIFFLSLVLNMLVVWGVLKVFGLGIRLLRILTLGLQI